MIFVCSLIERGKEGTREDKVNLIQPLPSLHLALQCGYKQIFSRKVDVWGHTRTDIALITVQVTVGGRGENPHHRRPHICSFSTLFASVIQEINYITK